MDPAAVTMILHRLQEGDSGAAEELFEVLYGDLHRRAGRLDVADACYEEALALQEAHSSPRSLERANLARRVALLREKQGRPTEARTYWRDARAGYAALDIDAGVDEADTHIRRLENY